MYDLNNLDLTEYEKYSDFKLKYINIELIDMFFDETIKLNTKNKLVYPEMLEVINELKKVI